MLNEEIPVSGMCFGAHHAIVLKSGFKMDWAGTWRDDDYLEEWPAAINWKAPEIKDAQQWKKVTLIRWGITARQLKAHT